MGGIVISGVLAAAMSSVDSSLNAVSSVIVVDVIQRSILPNRGEKVSFQLLSTASDQRTPTQHVVLVHCCMSHAEVGQLDLCKIQDRSR